MVNDVEIVLVMEIFDMFAIADLLIFINHSGSTSLESKAFALDISKVFEILGHADLPGFGIYS